MRRIPILLACFTLSAASAQESTPKVKPLTALELQQLVDQLGSRDYKEREKANKILAVEGERALPQLKAGLEKHELPEVQRRLEVLIARVNSERVFRATPITVDFKNASAKKVLAEICKQAGYKLQDAGGNDQKITLKLTDAPFWEAMDAVANATGLQIVPQDDAQKTIYAYSNDTISPFNTVSGPFKFTASNISSSRNIQLSNLQRRGVPTSPEYIGMGVQIFAEPKMPVVGIGAVTLVKAIDDKGSSLIPPEAGDDESRRAVRLYVANNYRSLNQSCSIGLVRGHRDATTIKELHAKVALSILIEERPEITVENILEAKKKKFAGNSLDLEVEEVAEAMGTISLKISLRQRDANPEDYSWWNTAVQRLAMYDDKGVKMTPNGVSEQNNGTGVVSMRMSFGPPPGKKGSKPSKMVLYEWISETREVEFKFKNVPLP